MLSDFKIKCRVPTNSPTAAPSESPSRAPVGPSVSPSVAPSGSPSLKSFLTSMRLSVSVPTSVTVGVRNVSSAVDATLLRRIDQPFSVSEIGVKVGARIGGSVEYSADVMLVSEGEGIKLNLDLIVDMESDLESQLVGSYRREVIQESKRVQWWLVVSVVVGVCVLVGLSVVVVRLWRLRRIAKQREGQPGSPGVSVGELEETPKRNEIDMAFEDQKNATDQRVGGAEFNAAQQAVETLEVAENKEVSQMEQQNIQEGAETH